MSVMPLTLVHPPTIRDLLLDETFARFMRRVPRLHTNIVQSGTKNPPWLLWVEYTDGTWKRKGFEEYADAYHRMRKLLKDEHVLDVAITSRRQMLQPPMGFVWQHRKFPWCARCRRPSMFPTSLTHRAIEIIDYTFDEPDRCYYCGIRRAALPKHSPR